MSLLTKLLGLDAKNNARKEADRSIAALEAAKAKLAKENKILEEQKKDSLRKTQDKQVRALRSSFRTPGFTSAGGGDDEKKEKLG